MTFGEEIDHQIALLMRNHPGASTRQLLALAERHLAEMKNLPEISSQKKVLWYEIVEEIKRRVDRAPERTELTKAELEQIFHLLLDDANRAVDAVRGGTMPRAIVEAWEKLRNERMDLANKVSNIIREMEKAHDQARNTPEHDDQPGQANEANPAAS